MSSNLLNLEANYTWSVERYETSPRKTKRKELAKKQILIDTARSDEKLSLRWFTDAELKEMGDDADDWPTEPREPLALAVMQEPPKVEDKVDMEELADVVEWNGYVTLTLDSVIAMCEKMREKYGGKTPVMGVEFGGFSALSGVQVDRGCLVIE